MGYNSAMPAAAEQRATIAVNGMNCASCVAHVEKAARQVAGVRACQVNLARGQAVVQFDAARTQPDDIASAITKSGYAASIESSADVRSSADAESQRVAAQLAHARSWLHRAIAGLILWLPVELTHWTLRLIAFTHQAALGHAHRVDHLWLTWLALATSTIAILYVGSAFYRSAWRALVAGTTNMDTLIAMGASVAYIYSLVAFIGWQGGAWPVLPDLYFMEAAGLLTLISLGHWLEARARNSAGSAIRELLNLAPPVAARLRDASDSADMQTEMVAVADVNVGDRVLIRPGDRVPVDGIIVDGRSTVDESMLTGESMPALRQIGDAVVGGTINRDGRLIVRVTKTGADTALAHIIQLIDHAQSTKPPVQRLADQIAAIFVPSVLLIALITAIGWYTWGMSHHWPAAQTWGSLAQAVCSVLIIACPCALGLAIPAAVMVGTGLGARHGILIRNVDALQQAETIDTVVLDKTGTITLGTPTVAEVIPLDRIGVDELLSRAASAELFSEHPLAHAIVTRARDRGLPIPEPTSFQNEPGLGVIATVEGREILVGNADWISPDHAEKIISPSLDGHTAVHVAARDGDGGITHLGTIALADALKSDSAAAVAELHHLGLSTVLLTGDNEPAARAVAAQVGIKDVRANVRPAGKADAIRNLQNRESADNVKLHVAMVGDGINDAPALASADLGIAVGSASDVAREAGGIVLIGDSLHGIAAAIRLSRATMHTIRQNLFFAFAYNVIAIPLAACGLLNPLVAALAMALSDVTVIGNALLLRRTKIR